MSTSRGSEPRGEVGKPTSEERISDIVLYSNVVLRTGNGPVKTTYYSCEVAALLGIEPVKPFITPMKFLVR